MHRSSTLRRAALGLAGGLPLLVAGVGLAAPAATAATPNATVAIGANGLTYDGLAKANAITVQSVGTRWVITDNGPITAGAGCVPAPGGAFEVHCQVPKNPNGTVRPIRVNGGGGDDTIRNRTAVRMNASGGAGNDVVDGGSAGDSLTDSFGKDVLRGNSGDDTITTDLSQADGLADRLEGGAGNDDLRAGPNDDVLRGSSGQDVLRGGLGADTLDGGSGSSDAVAYLDNGHDPFARLVISIDGKADDGLRPLGTASSQEKDNVLTSVEQVFAGHGSDVIFGSDVANLLHGNLGNDTIEGRLGADTINGGPGQDSLASNKLFGVPVADGAIDTLDGSTDQDGCRVPFVVVEADVTLNCEVINQD